MLPLFTQNQDYDVMIHFASGPRKPFAHRPRGFPRYRSREVFDPDSDSDPETDFGIPIAIGIGIGIDAVSVLANILVLWKTAPWTSRPEGNSDEGANRAIRG